MRRYLNPQHSTREPAAQGAPGLVKTSASDAPDVAKLAAALGALFTGRGDKRRSWLDLQREIAADEGADLVQLLAGRHTRPEARAKHRCWSDLHARGVGQSTIARGYGVDASTVCTRIRVYRERAAAAAAKTAAQ